MSRDDKVAQLEKEIAKYKEEVSSLEKASEHVLKKCGVLDTILEGLPHPFFIFDANTHLVKVANPITLQGRTLGNVTCYELTHHCESPCNGKDHPCPLEIIKTTKKSCIVEHIHFDHTGTPQHVEVFAYPVFNANGDLTEIIEYSIDITKRKKAEQELAHMATHDALTDLPNRTLFQIRLEQEILHARRSKNKIAIMLMDLDSFKEINDTLGHLVGDSLLKMLAFRLTKLKRESDTVARLGGDEFIFMLPNQHSEHDADHTVRNLFHLLDKPFEIDGHQIQVKASIGIAIYPDDSQDIESLTRYADIAMYDAKRTIGSCYRYYKKII
ncbi:MAG: sensor domain-containing diguanylate cyclase [Proteobacteria bacterium]|nr:sensor domain-containing diguanylate cyclase [Pseudomonadota bacterium]MBU1649368.1 sensor domain-containing diguanylate cyclase [Pseudomonadota bacterium]